MIVAQHPPGYCWSETGKIETIPDQHVADTIRLVFAKFRELGSARQVFLLETVSNHPWKRPFWLQARSSDRPMISSPPPNKILKGRGTRCLSPHGATNWLLQRVVNCRPKFYEIIHMIKKQMKRAVVVWSRSGTSPSRADGRHAAAWLQQGRPRQIPMPDRRHGQPVKRNRSELPAHLPRAEMIIDIEDRTCPGLGAP